MFASFERLNVCCCFFPNSCKTINIKICNNICFCELSVFSSPQGNPIICLLPMLLGAPKNSLKMSEIVSKACMEAELYRRCGLHGVIVENMHDVPYTRGVAGPEVTACMGRITGEVHKVVGAEMKLGVQILSCEFERRGRVINMSCYV